MHTDTYTNTHMYTRTENLTEATDISMAGTADPEEKCHFRGGRRRGGGGGGGCVLCTVTREGGGGMHTSTAAHMRCA